MDPNTSLLEIRLRGNLKLEQLNRLKCLIDAMVELVEGKFTGSIRINFSQGSVGRVEKFEEILKK
ncbi:MAG: hypothetical protein AB7W37_02090 [Syntrophobacteraceae bacterium]